MPSSVHSDIGSREMEMEMDCGGFFDHIDDFLDFPMNHNLELDDFSGKLVSFPSMWPMESDTDLDAKLSVPYEDIVQLEWLSNFADDSFAGCGSLAMNNSTHQGTSSNLNPSSQFSTSSPVSVLDSSSLSYGEKPAPDCVLAPLPGGRRGKARSKRPRPTTFNPRPAMQLISPGVSSVAETLSPVVSPKASSDSENYAESRPAMIKMENGEPKKKKKSKFTLVKRPVVEGEEDTDALSGQVVRKCLHCEITKTPQWRAGPEGPKSLCNACGVRYKSGRLFPEYRPAASPTFVPSVHSNSHKKVLEMRSKMEAVSSVGNPAELIPNPIAQLDYI